MKFIIGLINYINNMCKTFSENRVALGSFAAVVLIMALGTGVWLLSTFGTMLNGACTGSLECIIGVPVFAFLIAIYYKGMCWAMN